MVHLDDRRQQDDRAKKEERLHPLLEDECCKVISLVTLKSAQNFGKCLGNFEVSHFLRKKLFGLPFGHLPIGKFWLLLIPTSGHTGTCRGSIRLA